jgi:protein involved in polysaccharide export with SLBB domain
MSHFSSIYRPFLFSAGFWLAASLLTGCGTTPPSQSSTQAKPTPDYTSDRLHVGDLVNIIFSGVQDPPAPSHTERIKDDGHITLPFIAPIEAAGKTRSELQESILAAYVPKFYTHLTVVVGSENRFFYVKGQVKNPGRYPFAGEMTTLKCIAAAGDFTDFAKKSGVEVTRANGKKEKVDGVDAQRDPNKDLPIYPDDLIYVPRRYF